MIPVETSDVIAGEYSIRLHRAGNRARPAILFLHGSGPGATGLSNFAGNLDAFADDYDCLVIDQVGWGASSHPEEVSGGRIQQLVKSNLALLDSLGIEKAHLVGNSLGGVVALHMAARAPKRVDKIVGMGSGGGEVASAPSPELSKLISFYSDPSLDNMRDICSFMVFDAERFAGEIESISAERLKLAVQPEIRRSHELTFSPQGLAGIAVPQTALGRIKSKVLLIHGREDRVVPLAASEWICRTVPRASLMVVPHCAHWVQIEAADTFNSLTRLFFSGQLS